MRLPLSVRVAMMLISVLAFALALTAFLSYAKFEQSLSQVVASRQHFVMRDLAEGIETGLNLGLSLNEVQNYAPLLRRAAADHPDLMAARIVDTSGRAVATVGTATAAPAFALSQPLVNPFGETVGTVELHFSRAAYDASLRDEAWHLVRLCVITLVIGGALAALAAAVIMRPVRRSLDGLARNIASGGGESADEEAVARFRREVAEVEAEILAIRSRMMP